MGAAFFYHLTQQSVDQAMAALLPKCLQRDWRVLVRGRDMETLQRIDQSLWVQDDGFLPHGLAGGPHDDQQPILLGTEDISAPYDCLVTVQAAQLNSDEVSAAQRTLILFEAADEMQMTTARQQWATLTSAGCSAQYWSQESGRWEMKAEKN